MKRRTFLQQIGSILAVLGIAEAEWLTLSDSYSQALAQSNPRKLALLVGINKYRKSPSLSGCLTDVELQKELLIHRFGFASSNILTLTDEQASREFIEAAFLDHLGKQVKPDDVVVFHFSGYGTRIKLDDSDATLHNALVPTNENLEIQDEKIATYLLEETLLLLLRSLTTERVTAVLDTSYDAPNVIQPTGLRIRARQELATQLATAEIEFLKLLKTQNSLSNAVILSATSDPKQVAKEGLFSGFSAGLFTYALTQYLWETTPPTTIQFSLSHVDSAMYKWGSKQQLNLVTNKKVLTSENLLLDQNTSAEGAIIATEEDGKTVQLWLGGLPAQVLENYGVNSRFTSANGQQLILRSRTGLTAKAQISSVETASPVEVGQLIQESIRVLPRNLSLAVALDSGLERIEKVDATSAFAGIAPVASIITGEQSADYVFSKLLETPSRYGLFSPGGLLIPNSAGEVGEAVKVAVTRLGAKLPHLLAAKLWRLTENEGSSRLPIKVSLEIISGISPKVILQRETLRTSDTKITQKILNLPTVPIGSRIQYRIQNKGDRSVYLMLLGLKNHRTAIAFYPWQTVEEPNTSETKPLLQQVVIPAGETITLPQNAATSGWTIAGPAYECEHQLILSTAPFSTTLKALETAKYPTADQQPIGALVNPWEIAQALLQDLHNASITTVEVNGTANDSYVLNVNHWASFNFSFYVS
ncbi:caspase family protein [Nostoc sp. FACHB-152]|uniref:caspase family protein n=1 Tax=unclassified Nostoc TaxID=2593658 RepID=UPI001684B144|nr:MULTISPECIES: caspase family protein [unclassified Nostoc]MBD2450795.1 caspase family protein [Nostoc sp. FACHB-152]MBD2470232.1 caspase family protein [Nostoc sp. FACHB-145]